MADNLFNSLVTIATAIVGVAILAVLVSRNSQTPAVIQSAGNAFSVALQAATGPVTGGVQGLNIGSLTGSPTFGGNYNTALGNSYL